MVTCYQFSGPKLDYDRDDLVLELGQTIRTNEPFVNIQPISHFGIDDARGLRLVSNYVTVNLLASDEANLTVAHYWLRQHLPFSSIGCVPVLYVPDNPETITYRDIGSFAFEDQEPWLVVIFGRKVKKIALEVGQNVILATFAGQSLPAQEQERLLNHGHMLISNLKPSPLLQKQIYSGFIVLFDVLNRPSFDLPVLANLVLMESYCNRRLVETMSHKFADSIPIYPGLKEPKFDGNILSFPEHYGTHLDAPFHISEFGRKSDEITIDSIASLPCIKIESNDFDEKIDDPPLAVGLDSFYHWENENGMQIPENSLVFIDTDNCRNWPEPDAYMGRTSNGKLNIVGLHAEALNFLIKRRKIAGVGIDTISTDGSMITDTPMPSHVTLALNDAIGIENAAHIDTLPNIRTHPRMHPVSKCLMVPIRIQGGTAAPTAIFAITQPKRDDFYDGGAAPKSVTLNWCFTIIFIMWIILLQL